ncbi:MAG: PEGA domain-containing protein [Candidatus Aminicenantales bacterium]
MKKTRTYLLGWAVLCFLATALPAAGMATKLKVTHAPGAPVFRTPVLGRPFMTLPLNTILDAESKQGEFWKISVDFNGQKVVGYVHEVLVEAVNEAELQGGMGPLGPIRTQPELAAEIELKIEECQYRVVRERDLPDQVDTLRSLLPKVFNLEDGQKQKQLACDIYHWTGQALSKQGDDARAIREFKNMFEVDFLAAKKATKYVSDPNISQLIMTAEKQYNGTFVGYSLQIDTEPKEAVLKIDGKVVGHSPDVLPLDTPNVTLEIEKEGYKTERVVLSLTDGKTAKSFALQSVARTVRVSSNPPGAAVFLDGKDTGKMTDCDLGYVPFGTHKLTVRKERYADWEDELVVAEGSEPVSKAAVLFAKTYFSVFIWGGPESKAFIELRAMTLDKDGSFYVVDSGPVKVRKYTRERGAQPSWGEMGKAFKSLKQPAGIAVDGAGICYITDARASTVNKFDKNGRFVQKWGKSGAKSGELFQPTGIAVDANNDIYVVDSGNSRVVKYSPKGVVIKTWGKLGPDPGQFYMPTAVAANTHGEVVVVDRGRIQKFTPDGELIAAFVKPDSFEAEIKLPVGVCCDGYDNIYVADGATDRVKKFQSNGRYIGSFGGNGSESGQMLGLVGIAVDVKGFVFVLEKGNRRMQEFQPPEK